MRKIWIDGIAILTFVFVSAVFFYPTLLQGKLPIPTDSLVGLYHPWRDFFAGTYPRGAPFKNFLITDPVRQEIPWRKIAIDQWKNGMIPFGNPFSFSGTSLAANIQAGAFYPLNVLFFLFDFPLAWTVLIILQPILGSIFLYMYLRYHKISVLSSFIGSLSWSFSGFFMAWLTWGTIDHVAMWLPVTLLSIDHLAGSKTKTFLFSKRMLWFSLFVFSLMLQFLAGHAQIALYALIFSFAYALWQEHSAFRKRFAIPWWFLSGVLFLMVLSFFQWIPFFRSVWDSGRLAEVSLWKKTGWFLPWQHTVQFLVPDFFGNPTTLNYWGEWNYGEFISYIGIVGVIGLSFALLYFRSLLFWVLALIVTLIFALPTPIAKIPYVAKLPFLQSMQPTRLIVIIDFICSVLAAYGFDKFFTTKTKKSWMGPTAVGLMLVFLWLLTLWQLQIQNNSEILANWLVTKRNMILPTIIYSVAMVLLILSKAKRTGRFLKIFMLAAIGLSVFDLLRFGWKFTPFTPRDYFFPETNTITFLKNQNRPFRVASIDKELLPPNVASFYGIEDIDGYDPVYNNRYEEYFAAMNRGEPDISPPFGFNRILTLTRFDTPLLPLLNVRYILTLKELNYPYLSLVHQEGNTRIYEDARSLPRAYLVNATSVVQKKRDIIHTLYGDSFRANKSALVEAPVVLGSSSLSDKDTITITRYNESSLNLTVSAADTRLLVISNIWSPFWRAAVDAKPILIQRVNYIFQGIVIEKGDHKISLYMTL